MPAKRLSMRKIRGFAAAVRRGYRYPPDLGEMRCGANGGGGASEAGRGGRSELAPAGGDGRCAIGETSLSPTAAHPIERAPRARAGAIEEMHPRRADHR